MRVRRKNILRVVIVFLVLLEITSVFLMWKSANNKDITLNDVKLKGVNKNSGLAIMIEQEDGTYKESSSNTWPEDMMFNEEKSGCIDNDGNAIDGALTYEGGIANIKTKSSSYCYLYFDIVKNDITIAISTDGVEGIMPNSGAYTNNATCSSGSISWSNKYQRIEIGGIGKTPSECNIAFTKDTSNKTLLTTEVESKATKEQGGYRYSGQNPNNYIWFNNEMWRIIGSIPTCLTSNCGTNTTNLVKIVRKEELGYIQYGTVTGTNSAVWGPNSLYTILNSYYFGKLNASDTNYCYVYNNQTKGKCDYTTIGINPNGYYGKMVKNVYWNTGSSAATVSLAQAWTDEQTTRTVSGYIGLLNATDYAFSLSTTSTSMIMNTLVGSSNDSWLNDITNVMTLTQNRTYTHNYNYIHNTGVISYAGVLTGYVVRPVIYLNSNVYIISGDGTITNPYIIGM